MSTTKPQIHIANGDFGGGSGSAIDSLTGDVTATGPGTVAATLANTAVTPATYGDSTHVSQVTVDSKGRVTSATSVAITTAGTGDVVGAAASVASEIVLFDGTSGKLIKRATGTGVVHATAGVYSVGNVALASEVSGDLPFANLAQIAGVSVLGVTGSSTADVAAITASADGQVLRRASSSSLAFSNIGVPLVVRKTGDESVTSSAALQDDDELFFAIGASDIWVAHFVIGYNAATTGDFQFAFSVPSGATGRQFMMGLNSASTGVTGSLTVFSTTDLTTGNTFGGGGVNDASIAFDITVVNSTNAGNVKLRWAQGTSDGTATIVRANSYLQAMRVQ